ncbi:MAG: MFS transporter, partial [Flavobacteriales bacterium]
SKGLSSILGLDAFSMFKEKRYFLFFMFSMLLGAALQLTNAYGATFLHTFDGMPEYRDSIAVKFPALTMSLSQISETLFILAIPFFMRRFSIKQVMLMSMVAWVLRFGLLAFGDPGSGLWMILLSCIIYGMAFDFFNISGSLYIETQVDPSIRSSAQGLFTMMVNGVGAVFGSLTSGFVMAAYFTDANGDVIWKPTWIAFAGYSLLVAVLFAVLFRVPNQPKVTTD